jgi:hypothetical protein
LAGLFAGGCVTGGNVRRLGTPLRFGLIADPHYADGPPRGNRHYRESLLKVREAIERLRDGRVGFVAILGDMKDMVTGESGVQTLSHLVTIEREFQRFGGPLYHVLGNHDMDNLSKPQVLGAVRNTGIPADRSYYAFSQGGLRIIVLDATYGKDGRDYDRGKFDWKDANIPASQLAWFDRELGAAVEPVIVLVHQRLDGDGPASIRNRVEVRRRMEASGKVLAVFQGHDHAGFHTLINAIHYYTLRATVDGTGPTNNAYVIVEVSPGLDITVTGYRRAVGMKLARGAAAPAGA